MHIYECTDGTKVPSVTTILSVLGNVAINKWANYLGFKHIDYEKELQRLADKGTKMHECLQAIVDPENSPKEIEFNDDFEKDTYLRITDKFTREMAKYTYSTIFTEKTFISKTLGYGGTMDWFAVINGYHLINDFKSSKRVRSSQILQLGGYYNLLKDAGYTEIDGGSIILANDKMVSFHPISLNELQLAGDIFNKIADFYINDIHIQKMLDSTYITKIKEGK